MKTMIKTFLAFAIFAFSASLAAQPIDFNGYRGNDRTGVAPADMGLADDWSLLPNGKPKLLWETDNLGIIGIDHTNGQVAVHGGYCMTTTYKNGKRHVWCFDIANGNLNWSKQLLEDYGGTHDENPSVWMEDGKAYFHDDTYDYCYGVVSGNEIWKTPRVGDAKTSPIVWEGVYMTKDNSGWYAKDAADGSDMWTIDDGDGAVGSVSLWHTPSKDYAILKVSENNDISCVDIHTGNVIWSVDPPGAGNDGAPNTTPLAYKNVMILTTRNLDVSQPQVAFRLFPDEPTRQPELMWANGYETTKSSPVIYEGHVYWGWTTRQNAFAQCTRIQDGVIKYRENNPPELRGCLKGYGDLLLADGKLFGNDCLRSVMAWPDPDQMNIISTDGNNANHQTTPAIVDGKMYVMTYAGYTTGYDGESVARVKCYDISAPAGAAPVIRTSAMPDGKVGSWYSERLWVSSGNGYRTWSLKSGSLPAGVSLDGTAHMLEGVPTSAGTFTFTLEVTDEDGDTDSKQFSIFIEDNVYHPVTDVSLNKNTTSLDYLATEQLSVTISPSNASNPYVTWITTDDQIVTVDELGSITGVGEGTATIRVTSQDNSSIFDECVVTVTGCSVTPTVAMDNCKSTLVVGETYCLTTSIADPCNDLTDNTVTWSSSNASVLTVVDGCLTAISAGIATITATISNGQTATCAVTVSTAPPADIEIMQTVATITIDGVIDEADWNLSKSVNTVISGSTDNNTTFSMLWDNTNLYIAVKVEDADLFASTDALKPWKGDAVELYIDGNNEKASSYDANDYQVVKGYNNSNIFTSSAIAGITHAVAVTANGYAVEVAIPWSDIGVSPVDGKYIGIDVGMDEDDAGTGRTGQTMWIGDGSNWSNPSVFGTGKLVAGSIETFSLNITSVEGTVTMTPDKTVFTAGETVVLDAVPNSGYVFDSWTGDVTSTTNPLSITMDANKSITANYSLIPTYTITTTAVNGSVTLSPSKAQYNEGESVSVSATPDAGYEFCGWSGDVSGTNNTLVVTMDADLNITAEFCLIPTYSVNIVANNGSVSKSPDKTEYAEGETVTLTAVPNSGYRFDNWSGDASGTATSVTITMDTDKDITANFSAIPTYSLITTAVNGSVDLSPAKTEYLEGETVTLTAVPNSGYQFDNWSGDATGTNGSVTITMDADKNVTAHFSVTTNYTLTIFSANGSVTKSPDQSSYTPGTTVSLTATPGNGYRFVEWTGDASGTNMSITITMDNNKTVTANYEAITYTLSTTASNGIVSANPAKTAYVQGEQVEIMAIPNQGYQFDNWSGDASGTTNPVTITMDGNKSVTAIFSEVVKEYNLSVVSSAGGSVTKSPDKVKYTGGESVTLTVAPNAGYSFCGWSGDASGTTNSVTVVMDADKSITADFCAMEYSLTVNVANGIVSKNPDKATYTHGEMVGLTVVPDVGYQFDNWSGDATGTSNTVTITMDADKTVSANISMIPKNMYTLTLSALNGTVTANPQLNEYEEGAEVTLTAVPEEGYGFDKWIGDETGSVSIMTIVMDADKNIAASFKEVITGISAKNNHEVNIFPVPASTFFTVTSSSDINRVEVFNLLGQNMLSNDVSSREATVDITGILPGTYVVHVYKQDQIIKTSKLVIE